MAYSSQITPWVGNVGRPGLPPPAAPKTALNLTAPGGTLTPYTDSFRAPSGSLPTAPTATPYGAFSAPDPANFQHSPSFQYDMDQMMKTIQRSAAARGTLLTPDTLKSLQSNAMGLASRDYQSAFDRSLAGYNANRDTAAMNFGQEHTAYGDALTGHQVGYGEALDTYKTNRDTTAGNIDAGLRLGAFGSPAPTMANPPGGGLGGDMGGGDYAQTVAAARAANPLGAQPGAKMPAGSQFRYVNSGPHPEHQQILNLYNKYVQGLGL